MFSKRYFFKQYLDTQKMYCANLFHSVGGAIEKAGSPLVTEADLGTDRLWIVVCGQKCSGR